MKNSTLMECVHDSVHSWHEQLAKRGGSIQPLILHRGMKTARYVGNRNDRAADLSRRGSVGSDQSQGTCPGWRQLALTQWNPSCMAGIAPCCIPAALSA